MKLIDVDELIKSLIVNQLDCPNCGVRMEGEIK